MKVRQQVGYLPESVPLYPEMRVREYLAFRGKLRGMSADVRRSAIDRVTTRCWLKDVITRPIGQLSKGYRQRVGLADAMVHDPDILILDEPTAGLDPIQIREVRALIRDLGTRHTILISTHIMSEVEAVCSRVIIIAQGRIAEDQALDRLRTGSTIVVEARGPAEAVRRTLLAVTGVERAEPVEPRAPDDAPFTAFTVTTRDSADLREAIAQRLFQAGWGLRRLVRHQMTLEDRFIQAVTRTTLDRNSSSEAG
jgi:ABC-2 type transport system ATP-binding protein